MKVNRHQGLLLGKPDIRGFKAEHKTVKHGFLSLHGYDDGCKMCLSYKNSKQRGATGPQVASAIMVARWVDAAVMSLGKGKQTSLGSKEKTWRSNTTLEPSRV